MADPLFRGVVRIHDALQETLLFRVGFWTAMLLAGALLGWRVRRSPEGAFVLGVAPLVWAIGAGAELRSALGTAVFSGMIGVTVFGLIFTPVFYVVARWLAGRCCS